MSRTIRLRFAPALLRRATGVDFIGNATWRVKLVRGKTYRFVCDPHSDEMRGSFRAR